MKPASLLRLALTLAATLLTLPERLQAFTESEIHAAGLEALAGFQSTLESSPGDHGFQDAAEVRALTLGPALPVCRLDDSALAQYQPGQKLDSILRPPHAWYFPVKLGAEARALVSITLLRGTNKLAPESFGKAALARNLAPFLQAHPAPDLRLVIGSSAREVFLHIRSLERPNLTPLGGDAADMAVFLRRPADALPVLEALRAR